MLTVSVTVLGAGESEVKDIPVFRTRYLENFGKQAKWWVRMGCLFCWESTSKQMFLIYRLQLDWGEHLKKENTEWKCTSS